MKEYNKSGLSLIEKVHAINPDIARSFVLKTYAWPAAVLRRVGYFVEVGATMDDALKFALIQMTNGNKETRQKMIQFITEQNTNCDKVSVLNIYRQKTLPSTGIRIVDLSDPFTWNGTKANQTQNLISDLAGIARTMGKNVREGLDLVMGAQTNYFCQCILDLNQAVKNYTSARKYYR